MKVLFDTSVWISHFKYLAPVVQEALENDLVVIHPMILGELAVGYLPEAVFKDFMKLERLNESSWGEVIEFIRHSKLAGKGLSWVDVHLLHSFLSNGIELITNDKQLRKAYSALN